MCAWQSGGAPPSIPGLSGDGQTPGGIVVAGGITAGDPISGSLFNYSGNQTIQDVADSGAPLLELDQTAAATTAHGTVSVLRIIRGFQDTIHATAPLIYTENDDGSSTADAIQYLGPSIGQGFKAGVAGGVGSFSHAPQTAARTLAQSVITAITDANAKTAVQALANTLVDMGALTLT